MPDNCNKNICPSELNILLVPTCLQGMSNAQICAFIGACTKKSTLFKQQVLKFFQKMNLAKQYTAERKCYCPTKVEWAVSNPPLVISQLSLCNYFNFAACNNTGFALILRKVMEAVKKNKRCRQMIQDGKDCCCKKTKDCCGNLVKQCYKC